MAKTYIEAKNTSNENENGVVYIKGSEFVDDSVRDIVLEGDTIATRQLRTDGVWNASSIFVGPSSFNAGRDLKMEAAADFIKTENPSGFDEHSKALIPHVPFDDAGTGLPHTPITDKTADNVIFSTAVSETSGTTISQSFPISSAQIIKTISYEVGTIGATSDVSHTIYKGTDNTGDPISMMNLPSSKFVAGTTAMIDFGSAFGFSEMHVDIFVEFTTDTAFTLKTNASSNILITLNSQQLETRTLLHDDLVYDNDYNHIVDNDLNTIYQNQFTD